MTANETHVYISRGAAREAAIDAGLNVDDIRLCRLDTGDGVMKWGWVSSEAHEATQSVQAAEVESGPTAVSSVTDGEVIVYTMSDGSTETVSTDGHPTEDDEQSADAIMARNAERAGVNITVLPDTGGVLLTEAETVTEDEASEAEAEPSQGFYLRFGPFASVAEARDFAKAAVRKLRTDGQIVSHSGDVLEPALQTPPKPPKEAPEGSKVDEFDRPIRPAVAHLTPAVVKYCTNWFERIEKVAGDFDALDALCDTINAGDTNRIKVLNYARNHKRYAKQYGRSPYALTEAAD